MTNTILNHISDDFYCTIKNAQQIVLAELLDYSLKGFYSIIFDNKTYIFEVSLVFEIYDILKEKKNIKDLIVDTYVDKFVLPTILSNNSLEKFTIIVYTPEYNHNAQDLEMCVQYLIRMKTLTKLKIVHRYDEYYDMNVFSDIFCLDNIKTLSINSYNLSNEFKQNIIKTVATKLKLKCAYDFQICIDLIKSSKIKQLTIEYKLGDVIDNSIFLEMLQCVASSKLENFTCCINVRSEYFPDETVFVNISDNDLYYIFNNNFNITAIDIFYMNKYDDPIPKEKISILSEKQKNVLRTILERNKKSTN